MACASAIGLSVQENTAKLVNTKNLPDLASAGDSHVGLTRNLNEDRWLARGDVGLWVVADGMGGLARGERASGLVVNRLSEIALPDDLDAAVEVLCNGLESLNAELRLDSDGQLSGTTVVALILRQRRFAAIWAGDSRIYRMADGNLKRLSKDHSVVEQLVDAGAITAEQALTHPMANRITRAIGIEDRLDLEVRRGKLEAGDRFVLCSDGLHGMVDGTTIERLVAQGEPKATVERLIQAALAGGGRDNVSVVVVDIDAGNDLDTTL